MQFEPLRSFFWSTTSLSVLVVLAGIGLMVFLTKAKTIDKNYRNIFSMLAFFAVMMAAGSAIFSWLFGERIGPVKIVESGIESPYGTTSFEEIKNIVISINKDKSTLVPQVGTDGDKQLLVMLNSGKRLIFSKNNYPIQQMVTPMRSAWQNSTKKAQPKG